MSTHTRPATPTTIAVPLDAADLATLDTAAFYRHVGAINTAYQQAEAAYQAAQHNLTVLLTEQIARHVTTLAPAAALVFVRPAAEYHHDHSGHRLPDCEGHHHRLSPVEVVDHDGNMLGRFDPLSPVAYLLERLTPILGLHDHVLDLDTRQWAYDCTSN